jgi:hypothetical protein
LKKFIFLFLVCIFASSAFSQDKKHARIISNALEDISTQLNIKVNYKFFDNFGEPQYSIPGTVGYWDYMTNGANMSNIFVYGDTVIVCYPSTSQTDPKGATDRMAYYTVSYNGGATWEAPVPFTNLPQRSAYPEIHTYYAGGQLNIMMSGRKYNPGTAFGAAWKDAFLGLGSLSTEYVPIGGKDYFGAYLNGNVMGGLSSFPNSTTEDTLHFVKYDGNSNSFATRVLIANPGLGQIGANVRYRFAADQTGNNCLAVWYKDTVTGVANTGLAFSTSANGGTTWTTPTFIQKKGRINDVIQGDSLTPWFGIDAAYKPGSTNFGVAWSTLYANTSVTPNTYNSINTASKILFYSPSINGGVPVVVAGRQNMSIISDTAQFNNTQGLQVGVLPVSHPSLAWSADGSRLVCAFSAFQPGDSLLGYTFNDIYITYSDNGGLTWTTPQNLTRTQTEDELYPTLSLTGNTATKFHVHYQQTPFPGSQSFSDTTQFVAPVYQLYRSFNPQAVSVNNISTTVPDKFSLKQNYPNPFNPTTSIRFDVTKSTKMSLNVYDASGKLVQTLLNNEVVPTGTNEVVFNAGKLSSGVYFYTLVSDNFKETKKMMLIK